MSRPIWKPPMPPQSLPIAPCDSESRLNRVERLTGVQGLTSVFAVNLQSYSGRFEGLTGAGDCVGMLMFVGTVRGHGRCRSTCGGKRSMCQASKLSARCTSLSKRYIQPTLFTASSLPASLYACVCYARLPCVLMLVRRCMPPKTHHTPSPAHSCDLLQTVMNPATM